MWRSHTGSRYSYFSRVRVGWGRPPNSVIRNSPLLLLWQDLKTTVTANQKDRLFAVQRDWDSPKCVSVYACGCKWFSHIKEDGLSCSSLRNECRKKEWMCVYESVCGTKHACVSSGWKGDPFNTLKCRRPGANHSLENLIFMTVLFLRSWRQPDRHGWKYHTGLYRALPKACVSPRSFICSMWPSFGRPRALSLPSGLCLRRAATKQPQRAKPIGLQKTL